MSIGDLVEWVAGGFLIAAAWVGAGEAAGLATAGVFAFYEAQCLAGSPLTLRRSKEDEEARQ